LACVTGSVPILALLGWPSTSAAQGTTAERAHRPLVLVGVRYDAPGRATVSGGALLPIGTLGRSGDLGGQLRAYHGVLVDASVGRGAMRVAAGQARRLKEPGGPVLFGEDLLITVVRTSPSPRGATPASTYVGGEAGVTLLTARFSVGLAHRIAGPSGPKRTVFTWSIGFQTGW
jgi:hypothetical protein